MTGELHVERNDGIASGGDHATNTVTTTNIRLPEGGLRAAGEVACSARVAKLGPHTAGRLFVGREDELADLEAALAEGPGVITTGLGGVGKSTLAHRFADLHRGRYNPIWWIDAEDRAGIEAGLARLARHLYPDLALVPDPDAATWGQVWLAAHEGWLVVLDNATDPADVADLLGTAHGGSFVLTSRLRTGWEELAEPVQLGVLTPQQALDLLARAAGRRELLEGGAPLCEALGFLPLAVRLAAAYMRENGVTAATYLSRLTSRHGGVLEWAPAKGDPERTIARIWLVSLNGITERHGGLALDLLRILAWFAPTDVPVSLLHGLPETSNRAIDEALGRLAAFALIARDGDAVTVHRLVQAAARHTTTREPDQAQAVDTARRLAVRALRGALPHYQDPGGWRLWRRLLPHIDTLTVHLGFEDYDPDLFAVVDREASYLEEQGQTARSIVLFERVVAGSNVHLGPEHPDTLTFRNNLAHAYQTGGDLRRAIPLYEQTLAEGERILGPEHPGVLTFRDNLASAYRAAGDPGRAIPLHERNLAESERILEPEHPNALTFRNNLANSYRAAGDLGRAIPLYEQTLAESERILGPEHPYTLTSRNNLAGAYLAAGDPGRAIPLHEQTLADRERILGPEHPNTLISRNNLAFAYEEAGDLGRAIPLYEQTLAESERILGPEHPNTQGFRRNLKHAKAG